MLTFTEHYYDPDCSTGFIYTITSNSYRNPMRYKCYYYLHLIDKKGRDREIK